MVDVSNDLVDLKSGLTVSAANTQELQLNIKLRNPGKKILKKN